MKRFEYKVVIDELNSGGIVAAATFDSVTIHHSAVQSNVSGYDAKARIKSYTAWARQKGNKGMQYHFMIPYDNSDIIYCTNYVSGHVWHNSNYSGNQKALSVLVDGNFQIEQPSGKQLQKLEQILRDLNDNWFTKNGWYSFEKNIVPKSKGTVRTYSENIKVPSLHYHNEVAQAGNATACCGANLIPKVVDYRNKAGNVSWGVPTAPPTPPIKTCEEKLAEAVKALADEVKAHSETKGKLDRANAEIKVLVEQMKKTVEDCDREKKEMTDTIENQKSMLKALTAKNEQLEVENGQLKEKNIELEEALRECFDNRPGCFPLFNVNDKSA